MTRLRLNQEDGELPLRLAPRRLFAQRAYWILAGFSSNMPPETRSSCWDGAMEVLWRSGTQLRVTRSRLRCLGFCATDEGMWSSNMCPRIAQGLCRVSFFPLIKHKYLGWDLMYTQRAFPYTLLPSRSDSHPTIPYLKSRTLKSFETQSSPLRAPYIPRLALPLPRRVPCEDEG